MDFVRLGPAYSTDYMPDILIEGYNSLAWTERYLDVGDFELKSFDVEGMKAILPENTLVSHLETQHVMIVETHEINMVGEGADAQPEITIRGRSATTILEHRYVEALYQKKRRLRRRYSAMGAAAVLIYNAVDNNSGADLTRGDTDPDTELVRNHYPWNTKDVIPNVVITETVAEEGEGRWWKVEKGMLLPQLQRIMGNQDLGIRCLRPILPNSLKVLSVKRNLVERGVLIRELKQNVRGLRFDIYKGVDRTKDVKFSLLQGHLDDAQHLTSEKDFKTVCEIASGAVAIADVDRGPVQQAYEGWRRRTTFIDAGTPEIPDPPEKPEELNSNATKEERAARERAMDAWKIKYGKWKNKRDAEIEDFVEESRKEARQALKNTRRVKLFTGKASPLAPYSYGIHYNLGDKVEIVDERGRSTDMIITEFIRTEDANGDLGYPGLILPELL